MRRDHFVHENRPGGGSPCRVVAALQNEQTSTLDERKIGRTLRTDVIAPLEATMTILRAAGSERASGERWEAYATFSSGAMGRQRRRCNERGHADVLRGISAICARW